ncbi:MAG: EAL domain-containing protein [Pseudomonadales bacterium]|nr:EAL domain-containing protein [Pseudomonadales bacterium]
MFNDKKLDTDTPLILVVDDEAMMRVLAGESLRQAGFDVIDAVSGEQAIQIIEEQEPDLILLDVIMPGMNGFEVCTWLRTKHNDQRTPVLIMTGLEDSDSIDKSYDVGATDFITKPINYAVLNHRIRYILRQKGITDELRISEERLQLTQEVAQLGHWESIPDDPYIYLSQAARKIFGDDFSEGKILRETFYERIHPEDIIKLETTLQRAVKTISAVQLDFRITGSDGIQRILFLDLEPVVKKGQLQKLSGVFQDITDRREAEQHIHQLSHFDDITGLPNRSYFLDGLSKKVRYAKQKRKSVAVFMLGIDNLKVINQSLGREASNQLLSELSKLFERFIRIRNTNKKMVASQGSLNPNSENDLLSSLGGDEFAFALWGVRQAEEAGWIATALMHLVKAPIELCGQEVVVTCSIGVSFFPLDGVDPDNLLKNSEAALHHAKSISKGGYQFFSESMTWQSTRRLTLESEMRVALEQKQFTLHYQPKVNIKDHSVSGVEALIRWIHPEQGFISPGEFIPVSEETGQILEIGKWVLETACKQAKRWVDQGTPLCVSVNVSMLQLRDYDFCQLVSRMLQVYELDPKLIQLELVESMLMDSMDDNSQKMRVLRDLGVTIAIDDFGTGYSSMAYLSELPLDVLKIDKTFIDSLVDKDNPAAIVEATIALAHALDLKVVAEGVEEKVQVDTLIKLGCDEIQGYYYSRPLAVSDFDPWLIEFNKPENQP